MFYTFFERAVRAITGGVSCENGHFPQKEFKKECRNITIRVDEYMTFIIAVMRKERNMRQYQDFDI